MPPEVNEIKHDSYFNRIKSVGRFAGREAIAVYLGAFSGAIADSLIEIATAQDSPRWLDMTLVVGGAVTGVVVDVAHQKRSQHNQPSL